MGPILDVTIPFFALVLAGHQAGQRHGLPESATPELNDFILYFALPCLLFRFGSSLPLLELLNPTLLGVYILCALVVVFGTIALTRGGVGMKDASFGALVAAFPNSGFMGVPLLVALMGQAAAGPVIATILADMVITSSLCLALAHTGRHTDSGSAQSPAAAGARALRGALSNPLPYAIALGGLFSVMQWTLPGPAGTVVSMLADAASPVALFTIGAVLHRARQHAHTRTPAAHYVPVALIKLVAHPALVFAACRGAQALGLPLTELQVVALTLTAALPSASSVSLLAERYAADNGRVARIILASTAAAFVTFTALAWLFGVRGGN